MSAQRIIEVWADWLGLGGPTLMGRLLATLVRGKEVFSFEYDRDWLAGPHRQLLDPTLGLFAGPQYPSAGQANFGVLLDSCPDRWGRVLLSRREAQLARLHGRKPRRLRESDFLLGVHDGHRMGALRFRTDGAFLDDDDELAVPPWTSLAALEHACLQLERDDADQHPDYGTWLRMLIAPGSSLGGARPKASVADEHHRLWIAKFPSRRDEVDVGAWEAVIHDLAGMAGVVTPEAQLQRLRGPHRSFLSRRFDRTDQGARRHFASAMTLLERQEGADASDGVSYLELVELLAQQGARAGTDLEELWRRIAFFVCVSNTDDHLRNHGFLLEPNGWSLAPAYDMNPDPYGEGLRLNISESDNAQDLDLVLDVTPWFRVGATRAREILEEVVGAVRGWRAAARARGIARSEQDRMEQAFRVAEGWRAGGAAR
ncbi:MAG: type II toxin-antitoxin system HipA family toxin [Deltaproteobacteria bacterium]|nr:type II toxin-antitoxin system HipA family toxin [Deltaproteobacteria bacterium]